MESEESLKSSNKASPPQPTQAGRIKPCMELISKAMKCLESNDKQCTMRLIEELVRADCHNGYVIDKETVNKVKDVIHELWLVSNNEYRCELLRMLGDFDLSKKWIIHTLKMRTNQFNQWLIRCGIEWKGKISRNNVVKVVEDLLRKKFNWDEERACEELFKFIGIDINAFRRREIEPCSWLKGLESLRDLRRPYWFGLARSDLMINKHGSCIMLGLNTTNTVSAVFFPVLLSTIKTPSLSIGWRSKLPTPAKYVNEKITSLLYYVDLGINEWPWPTELSADEFKRILYGLTNEELAEFVAGMIDGDGFIQYNKYTNSKAVYVGITACKACPKRMVLDVLKEVIAKRFGIVGTIYHFETTDALVFGGKKAIRLLRRVTKYMHHPLRRLRAELILAYYDGKINEDEFKELYEQTKYEQGAPDVKHNNALAAATRAAPQTHTHGITSLSDYHYSAFLFLYCNVRDLALGHLFSLIVSRS
jgi:hypothetical protein